MEEITSDDLFRRVLEIQKNVIETVVFREFIEKGKDRKKDTREFEEEVSRRLALWQDFFFRSWR